MSDPCPTEIIVRVVPPAPVEITAEVGVIYVSDPGGGGGGVPTNRTFTAGSGLVGGGDFSVNRTFAVDWGAGTNQVPRGDDARFTDARTPTAHASTHTGGGADEIVVTQTQVTGLGIALAALQLLSEKGQADGYAPLDGGALLPDSYIPAGIVRDAAMVAAIGAAVDTLVASAPGLLDTLAELAQALGNDPAFATTMTNLIATKVAKSLYNANTILVANTDDTPIALDVAEQTLIGRVTGGNIAALTPTQIKTLLAITISDITGMQAALDALVPATRQVIAGSGLTGGGTLAVNRTLSADFGLGAGKVVEGNAAALTDQRVPTDGSVTDAKIQSPGLDQNSIVDLVADLLGKVDTTREINGHPLSADVTVTAGDVGLGDVDDTSDADKPVSTAQAAADAAVLAAANTYADSLIAAADALVFKGIIDASTNPNYPAANAGWLYRIADAGKVGGASGQPVEIGDIVLCLVDGTVSGSQVAVGANWAIIQNNIDGAVIGPTSATDGHLAVFDGASGKIIRDGGATGTYGLSVLATISRSAFITLLNLAEADIPALTIAKTTGLQAALDSLDTRLDDIESALPGKVTATLDTDVTFAADSDTRVASQKATNARIASLIAAGGMLATFSNADFTVLSTYRRVFQNGTLSTDRVLTLPLANSVAAGTSILVLDVSGTASLTAGIVVTRAGSDTIDGATTEPIRVPYGGRVFYSDGASKWTFDGGIVRKTGATFTGPVIVSPTTVTYAGSVAIDASTVAEAQITLTGNLSLANPTGGTHGQKLLLVLTQGGSGSYTVTFAGSKFAFTADITSFTASTAVGKIDYIGLRYDSARDKWDIIAVNKGAG